jgi:hypothetical protein
MKKKNHDYSGKSGTEPFANFTRAESMGITTTEKGLLVRMLDKMSRLSSFTDSGEFMVEDEKLQDTIIDMINYSILLYAYIQSKSENTYEKPYDVIELYTNATRQYMIELEKKTVVMGSEDPKRV